jgi:hypothetical protein
MDNDLILYTTEDGQSRLVLREQKHEKKALMQQLLASKQWVQVN